MDCQQSSAAEIVTVDVHKAKDLLHSGYPYLEVRTEEEFKNGHVDAEKIVNIPYMFFKPEGRFKNPKFVEQVSAAYNKDDHLVVGCQSGARSLKASTDLVNAGFKHVYNMDGGYAAWVENGFLVKKPSAKLSVAEIVTVDVHKAKDLLHSGYPYLEVRTEEEFKNGHVDAEKIVNIPYMFFKPEGRLKNPKFVEQVSAAYNKDDHLVVGCQSGARSLKASTDLVNAGFKHVYNMDGGYAAWVENGFLVKKPSEKLSVAEIVTVDVHKAKDLLHSGYPYLEVRTEEEFKNGHVDAEEIVNIPYMFFKPEGRIKNPKFVEQVLAACNKEDHLVVGCQSGARSLKASTDLVNAGFEHVFNMDGGYAAWVENGFPVVKP